MSFRRDSYSILRIGTILQGTVKVDRSPLLYLNQNNLVKLIKIYGIITDKVLNDEISVDSSKAGYLFKVDDGTGAVWVKSSSFNAETLKKWDFVRIIGSIDLDISDGKTYEIVVEAQAIQKVTNKNWELVHILESNNNKQSAKSSKKQISKSPKPDENESPSTDSFIDEQEQETPGQETLPAKIERILRENDTGNGVEIETILKLAGEVDEQEVDDILFELAYEGKVFQPKPDYYRIMD